MSKRDDMIAALERRRPSGAVPLWELEFQAWDSVCGRHVILGHEFEALTRTEQERAMYTNAEILIEVSATMEYSALTTPNVYWEKAPGQLAYYCLPGETRYRQAAIVRELAPPDLVLVAVSGGVIGADYSAEFCYRLVDAPASIDEMARNSLRAGIDTARRFRDAGIDVVVTPSDFADNHGPFFNPQQMERWILPYLTQWSVAAREMGMHSILHTDGNITSCLDAIASTGVDAVQAVDPVAGMDMRKAMDIVGGRLCLCGNIDCGLLLRGAPEDVYNATRNLLTTCKDGGGLVLGASNAVQPEVPVENYAEMIRAWKEFGQY